MARRRVRGNGGGARRSQAFKSRNFKVTCAGCGREETVPVRPPHGVSLYCMACTNAKPDESTNDLPSS